MSRKSAWTTRRSTLTFLPRLVGFVRFSSTMCPHVAIADFGFQNGAVCIECMPVASSVTLRESALSRRDLEHLEWPNFHRFGAPAPLREACLPTFRRRGPYPLRLAIRTRQSVVSHITHLPKSQVLRRAECGCTQDEKLICVTPPWRGPSLRLLCPSCPSW